MLLPAYKSTLSKNESKPSAFPNFCFGKGSKGKVVANFFS